VLWINWSIEKLVHQGKRKLRCWPTQLCIGPAAVLGDPRVASRRQRRISPRSSPIPHGSYQPTVNTHIARRFLPGSTETSLLADSTVRGFAISFFTSRRVASLNALFFLLGGITP
jgi:hypothetical protein